MQIYDLIIVGGGPCGLAAGIEASKAGLKHLILEKGSMTESLRKYPKRMRFFSTAENIEIGGIPFPISGVKATRDEALQYYRKVAGYYKLNFQLFTEVNTIEKQDNIFVVIAKDGQSFLSKKVVLATGYFDFPRRLGISGEDLAHVSNYYDEPFKYSYTKVVIVGGANSAVEAALELYRHDVDVTVVHKGPDFRQTVKYWLIPDVKNRVKEGKIKTKFNALITKIEATRIEIENVENGEKEWLEADFVFLLVGYVPDADLLKNCGVTLIEPSMVPVYDPETFETNVSGLYVCGTVMAGVHTEKVFIENGRDHAAAIIDHITKKPIRKVKELIERL